jgi:hypothetical protein
MDRECDVCGPPAAVGVRAAGNGERQDLELCDTR